METGIALSLHQILLIKQSQIPHSRGEDLEPNLLVKSSKQPGEHGVTLARILSLGLNPLYWAVWLHKDLHLQSFKSKSFSFELVKYPQLGWYLTRASLTSEMLSDLHVFTSVFPLCSQIPQKRLLSLEVKIFEWIGCPQSTGRLPLQKETHRPNF